MIKKHADQECYFGWQETAFVSEQTAQAKLELIDFVYKFYDRIMTRPEFDETWLGAGENMAVALEHLKKIPDSELQRLHEELEADVADKEIKELTGDHVEQKLTTLLAASKIGRARTWWAQQKTTVRKRKRSGADSPTVLVGFVRALIWICLRPWCHRNKKASWLKFHDRVIRLTVDFESRMLHPYLSEAETLLLEHELAQHVVATVGMDQDVVAGGSSSTHDPRTAVPHEQPPVVSSSITCPSIRERLQAIGMGALSG